MINFDCSFTSHNSFEHHNVRIPALVLRCDGGGSYIEKLDTYRFELHFDNFFIKKIMMWDTSVVCSYSISFAKLKVYGSMPAG